MYEQQVAGEAQTKNCFQTAAKGGGGDYGFVSVEKVSWELGILKSVNSRYVLENGQIPKQDMM